MSSAELTARINRFMDRKLAKTLELGDLSGRNKVRRSPRRHIEVSHSPYIALTIK